MINNFTCQIIYLHILKIICSSYRLSGYELLGLFLDLELDRCPELLLLLWLLLLFCSFDWIPAVLGLFIELEVASSVWFWFWLELFRVIFLAWRDLLEAWVGFCWVLKEEEYWRFLSVGWLVVGWRLVKGGDWRFEISANLIGKAKEY